MSEDLIKQFQGLSGASHDIAEQYLQRNDNIVDKALEDYNHDTIGREPTISSQHQSSSGNSHPKFESMAELRDEEEQPEGEGDEKNFFTGGEKSGLQVQNPNDPKNQDDSHNPMSLVEDLLKKAQREAQQPDTRKPIEQPPKPKFKGPGFKLGSVENHVESSEIDNPSQGSQVPGKVTRTITFWKEGFQVDDGKLYRYDDPANANYLEQLNQGRAPLSLLNVEMFQDVDVQVIKKVGESYQPPKRKAEGFFGEGRRLGSPVPGEPIVIGQEEPSKSEEKKVEKTAESKGDTRIQIRLVKGQRLVHNFNSTDPVSTIYDFVEQETGSATGWTLALAFPFTPLADYKDKTIAEAKLANSVVVQRHT